MSLLNPNLVDYYSSNMNGVDTSISKDKRIAFVIVMILFYQHIFTEAFGGIPFLLLVLYALLDVLYFIGVFPDFRRLKISKECLFYILFVCYASVFGIVITDYKKEFIGFISIAIEYLVLFLAVYYIGKKHENIVLLMKSVFALSFIAIIIALIRQQYIYNRLVLSYGSNANVLGNLCVVCVCASVFLSIIYKKGWLVIAFCVPITCFVAILTASKKTILVIAVIVFLFIVFRLKKWLKKHFLKVAIVFGILLLVLVLKHEYLISAWKSTNIYARFMNFESIDIGRFELYQQAFDVFKLTPIFGVGYQCFQFYSATGLYAHSAYAEVLSGTGIIGLILWGCFYFGLFYKCIKSFAINRNNAALLWCFIWMCSQFILDFSSASLYSPINIVLLAILLSIIDYKLYESFDIKA